MTILVDALIAGDEINDGSATALAAGRRQTCRYLMLCHTGAQGTYHFTHDLGGRATDAAQARYLIGMQHGAQMAQFFSHVDMVSRDILAHAVFRSEAGSKFATRVPRLDNKLEAQFFQPFFLTQARGLDAIGEDIGT